MQESADLSNWKEWVFPALIQVLGILMGDASKKGGVVPLLIASCILLTLPSCRVLDGIDVNGKIYYQHGGGAKGGIDLRPGKNPSWWIRLPEFKTQKDGLAVEITPPEIVPVK